MSKVLKVFLVLMVLGTLVSCGNSNQQAQDQSGCPVTIGLVTDTGGVDDKSFNQSAWEGIVRFQEENKISADCISYLQSNSDADYVPNLRTYVDSNTDLIIAAGYSIQEAIDTVSAQAPNSKFLFIDSIAENSAKNVMSAVFAQEEGSYLVGVAAGLIAADNGSNKVGFIGGMEGDAIGRFQAGYEQGVLAANPDATIYVDYCDSYNDSSKGQQLAEKQYGAGATVIFQAAGSAGNGVIKAAKERQDVFSIGVDRDQYEDGLIAGKSIILTSMIKHVDIASYTGCKDVLENNFKPEINTFNVANDGVGAEVTLGRNLSDTIIEVINKYRDQIMSKEITVSAQPTIANGSTNK